MLIHLVGCSYVLESHSRKFGAILLRNSSPIYADVTRCCSKFCNLDHFGYLVDMNLILFSLGYIHSIKTNVDAKFHDSSLSIFHAKVPKMPQKCPKMPFLAVFLAANFFPAKISKFFSWSWLRVQLRSVWYPFQKVYTQVNKTLLFLEACNWPIKKQVFEKVSCRKSHRLSRVQPGARHPLHNFIGPAIDSVLLRGSILI